MSRIIYCQFLKCEAEGQDWQIFPGELGKKIFAEISKKAWMQWQYKQTILINEQKLSMRNAIDRKIVEQEMINFLFYDHHMDI